MQLITFMRVLFQLLEGKPTFYLMQKVKTVCDLSGIANLESLIWI